MMKILKYNRYRYLITPAVILVFLSSSTAYPAPDLCLRQRAAVERPPQTPEANIARAQALLSRLNIKVGECIRQLKVIKAEIARNPTEGNQKWRGLIADRLMLILKDMRALKAYIIRAYGPLEPFPDIRLENYIEDIPCPPGEAVQYEFLPARYIRPASASSEIRKRHMKKTVNVLMAGGAGTRLQELYHMTPTERKLAGAGDLSTEELKNVSKPTIPYTPIMHKSPIVVIIESLRRIAQDEGDTPVVIIPGPDTNVPILKALRKNKWFGLKKVIIKNQGTLPVYNAHYADSQQLLNNGGPVEYEPNGPFIEAPDGGGGTLMALGKKGILVAINGKEAVLADKSAMEWLDENFTAAQDMNFLQTDMAIGPGEILGLTGARIDTSTDVCAMCYDYPIAMVVKFKEDAGRITRIFAEEQAKIGTLFQTGERSSEIVEYAEMTKGIWGLIYSTYKTRIGVTKEDLDAKLDELVKGEGGIDKINEKSPNERKAAQERLASRLNAWLASKRPGSPQSIIPGNAGAYNLTKEAVRGIIAQKKMKPHPQENKDRQDIVETPVKADNLEWFMTDLPDILGETSVALISAADALPTKNPQQFGQSRRAYADRHAQRLRDEFKVPPQNIGRDAIVEFSPLYRGTIDPTLRLGSNARLYLGGSFTGNGVPVNIGRDVKLEDGATVIIIGNGAVKIEDGAVFKSGTTTVIESTAAMAPNMFPRTLNITAAAQV